MNPTKEYHITSDHDGKTYKISLYTTHRTKPPCDCDLGYGSHSIWNFTIERYYPVAIQYKLIYERDEFVGYLDNEPTLAEMLMEYSSEINKIIISILENHHSKI